MLTVLRGINKCTSTIPCGYKRQSTPLLWLTIYIKIWKNFLRRYILFPFTSFFIDFCNSVCFPKIFRPYQMTFFRLLRTNKKNAARIFPSCGLFIDCIRISACIRGGNWSALHYSGNIHGRWYRFCPAHYLHQGIFPNFL